MIDKQFVIGRDNFALTIFIPVDCKNNCPFCTSKAEYKTNKPNLAKVIRAIKHVAEYDIPFKDIVITGGEPFADIDTLDCIISLLEDYFPDQKCYINTSLPKNTLEEAIKYINDSYYIDGINVSRHLKEVFSEKVASDDDIARIKVSKHLNCVLFKEDVSDEDLINYCDRMCGLGQPTFRADYRTITQENLHSFEHKLFKKLDRLFGYVGSTQCHVCHTDRFENGCVLHRGVELSHIEFANKVEVNDLIIKQNGEIRYDWDPEYVVEDYMLEDLGGLEREVEEVERYTYFPTNIMDSFLEAKSSCGSHHNRSFSRCGGYEPILYSGCGSFQGGCGGSSITFFSSGCGGSAFGSAGGC